MSSDRPRESHARPRRGAPATVRPAWTPPRAALAVGALAVGALAACAAPTPGPTATPTHTPRVVRIVSYNVKHGLGMDGRLDLERTAAVLRAAAPDVVLLQEVDERTARAGGVDQAAALGALLGMEHHFAPFMDFDGGRYGLALLSRLPVAAAEVVPLPPGKQEPRAALCATLDLDGLALTVANAHLDWLRDDTERVAQARALRAALEGRPGSVLLGGDLNDARGSATLAVFTADDAFALLGPDAATFPSDAPSAGIDHFLLRAPRDATWIRSEVVVLREAVASDHRPIALTLTIGPPGLPPADAAD